MNAGRRDERLVVGRRVWVEVVDQSGLPARVPGRIVSVAASGFLDGGIIIKIRPGRVVSVTAAQRGTKGVTRSVAYPDLEN